MLVLHPTIALDIATRHLYYLLLSDTFKRKLYVPRLQRRNEGAKIVQPGVSLLPLSIPAAADGRVYGP